jgi:hypothetical protein
MKEYSGNCWDCWSLCPDELWCFTHQDSLTEDEADTGCNLGVDFYDKLFEEVG